MMMLLRYCRLCRVYRDRGKVVSILLAMQKCSESHGFTRNEYRDEANYHRPMSKQDTGSESSDEARFPLRPEARCRPVRCPAQTAVSSQPPYTYSEAATLCVTDSLPSASKVNISTRTLTT
ncbi:hypothetical protein FHG87_019059 [Trinorchestia longiramus]|nr:hypothetical protein FHG87_019059 [Trinorchestia longiramus]